MSSEQLILRVYDVLMNNKGYVIYLIHATSWHVMTHQLALQWY